MYLIVGLGNPGIEHAQTRHNLGFLVADELASSAGARFNPGKGEYWFARFFSDKTEIIILKPVTYMNNSGIAVQQYVEHHKVPLENILVVCDDFQLPLGTIRLRMSGSDGGHNGLSSVIYHLQTDQFARLRCGTGSESIPAEKSKMKEYVLERFSETEFKEVQQMVKRAQTACQSFIINSISQALGRNDANMMENIS